MGLTTSTKHSRVQVFALLTLTVVLGLAAGCTSENSKEKQPQASVSASASPSTPTPGPTTPADPNQAVLSAYDGYWKALEQLDDVAAAARPAILRPHAIDPAYARALAGYAVLDQKNQKYYGTKLHRATVISREGRTATVRDCSDGSQYGLMDKKSGKQLNRGTPAALTEATLRQNATGSWQVANINAGIGAC